MPSAELLVTIHASAGVIVPIAMIDNMFPGLMPAPALRGGGLDSCRGVPMSVLTKLFLFLLGLATLVLATGVFLPATRTVEREITIDAPRATVFALINNPGQYEAWLPLTKIDPYVDMATSGESRGIGAIFSWQGDAAGTGRSTITESEPYDRVVSRLEIAGVRRATSSAVLNDSEGNTTVRWTEFRDFGRNLVWRYQGLYLERILGQEIELALENLKGYAENLPKADFAGLRAEEIDIAPIDIAFLAVSSAPTASAIATTMSQSYFRILSFIKSAGLQVAGAPLSISRAYDGAELRFDVAIPVTGNLAAVSADESGVLIGKTYGGPVLRAIHVGPYNRLTATHAKIAAYIAANGIKRNGDSWEAYVSDPTQTPQTELETFIYYPIADMAVTESPQP
jgi:effector-binding domain-containing protein/uncharacterized protein YndB with AHSA1/START domain